MPNFAFLNQVLLSICLFPFCLCENDTPCSVKGMGSFVQDTDNCLCAELKTSLSRNMPSVPAWILYAFFAGMFSGS